MTLFWLKPTQLPCAPAPSEPTSEQPEFDEDGRRYVFRFSQLPPRRYQIDRDRLFFYARTHELPGPRARMIRRDLRNSANFYEDVREIQTHPDVVAVEGDPSTNSVTRLRLRSESAELQSAS